MTRPPLKQRATRASLKGYRPSRRQPLGLASMAVGFSLRQPRRFLHTLRGAHPPALLSRLRAEDELDALAALERVERLPPVVQGKDMADEWLGLHLTGGHQP